MKDQEIQSALTFTQSPIWNSVLFIIDQIIETEVDNAINQSTDESKRVHQCGRADAAKYIKQTLIDTRIECQKRSGIIIQESQNNA